MDIFLSDKRDELEKEKKKNDAVRTLLPKSFEGVEDNSAYYLAKSDWSSYQRLSDGVFAPSSDGQIKKEKEVMKTMSSQKKTPDSPKHKTSFEEINRIKFDSIIPIILKNEGGYVNDPNDRGGETNYGITKDFYEDYKHCVPGIPDNIKDITKEDAIKLYKGHWDRHRIGEINDRRKALLLFDYIVNSGPRGVNQRMQDSLNARGYNLKVDGVVGSKTINAINDIDFEDFATLLQFDRGKHYEYEADENARQKKFIKGWIKRLNNLSEIVGFNKIYKSKYE